MQGIQRILPAPRDIHRSRAFPPSVQKVDQARCCGPLPKDMQTAFPVLQAVHHPVLPADRLFRGFVSHGLRLPLLRAAGTGFRPGARSLLCRYCSTGFRPRQSRNPAGKVLVLYVRAGESARVNVKDGEYTFKYASGETWYGMAEYFGEKTDFYKAMSNLVFSTSYGGGNVYYHEQQITIAPVDGGNMGSLGISEDSF